MSQADGVVDGIVGHYDRASKLLTARKKVIELNRDIEARKIEIHGLGQNEQAEQDDWSVALKLAAIPHMVPSLVRDWQVRHAECLTKLSTLQSKSDELEHIETLREDLRNLMRDAINRVGLAEVRENESLNTLQAIAQDGLREVTERVNAQNTALGQEQQRKLQLSKHEVKLVELKTAVTSARSKLDEQASTVLLVPGESTNVYRARLAEFDALRSTKDIQSESTHRLAVATQSLESYANQARAIASAINEPEPSHLNVTSEQWHMRLEKATRDLAAQKSAIAEHQNASKQVTECGVKVKRHDATLARLCVEAGVESHEQLLEAEDQSSRKRAFVSAKETAETLLTKASRRSRNELEALRAERDVDTLHIEEAEIEVEIAEIDRQLPPARGAEDEARHALESIDSSDGAAEAGDAMGRAAATMRKALSVQMRYRLAHKLLLEAMHRFKQRTQAPMLKRASEYFAQITGGEFEGLVSDDSDAKPIIVGKRSDGGLINVGAMSEGTRDQLYLALRLAALELQRDRGIELPLVLDDVLMTSDDARAGCILQALANFSKHGQVIVFTHHGHLCDVAKAAVSADQLAVVPLPLSRLQVA